MVLSQAREARLDWNNDIFFLSIASGHLCWRNLFSLCCWIGHPNLYLKLAGRAFTGFATVILLELIIGSLLMISLGIIGEYLARIYEEVKGRPRYIVRESIEPEQ